MRTITSPAPTSHDAQHLKSTRAACDTDFQFFHAFDVFATSPYMTQILSFIDQKSSN